VKPPRSLLEAAPKAVRRPARVKNGLETARRRHERNRTELTRARPGRQGFAGPSRAAARARLALNYDGLGQGCGAIAVS